MPTAAKYAQMSDVAYQRTLERNRASYRRNRLGRLSQQREYAHRNPHVNMRATLKRGYGLTIEQFNEMLAVQEGLCASCRRPPLGKGKANRLHVDHCHVTGRVRGLLCMGCNVAAGLLKDSPDLCRSLATYLERITL